VALALPIVGRAVERDAMSAAYASAQTGQSQLLLITGQAGIAHGPQVRRQLARPGGMVQWGG